MATNNEATKTQELLTRLFGICDRNVAQQATLRKQKEDNRLADLRRRGTLWCPHKNE
jgi:hypothetical protein